MKIFLYVCVCMCVGVCRGALIMVTVLHVRFSVLLPIVGVLKSDNAVISSQYFSPYLNTRWFEK